jgi:hypothetical protein
LPYDPSRESDFGPPVRSVEVCYRTKRQATVERVWEFVCAPSNSYLD